MTVQIITDSGSDLPKDLAESHGITVVPLQVLVGGNTYRDGVDLPPEEFYAQMRGAKELPKTSQPTPHDLTEAYQKARSLGPVIGIHLSSALSGTWQTASMVARSIGDTISVFDSRTGSGALAIMALEAARMARAGAGVADIEHHLEELRNSSFTLVSLNTLENAVKGGRVSPFAGMAASLLGVKPIVEVTRAGKVEALDKVRGRARSLERVLEIAGTWSVDWAKRTVAVAHGAARAEAEAFAAKVRERFAPRELILTEIGATIGTYAAEGAMLLGC